uniref:Nuclear transcription factor Y subunit n=1 Tax=Zingiber officinale TaxID=94328 RepID=A0AA50CBQ0_ZINOF|nr:NFY protein [Zingiber officinale]
MSSFSLAASLAPRAIFRSDFCPSEPPHSSFSFAGVLFRSTSSLGLSSFTLAASSTRLPVLLSSCTLRHKPALYRLWNAPYIGMEYAFNWSNSIPNGLALIHDDVQVYPAEGAFHGHRRCLLLTVRRRLPWLWKAYSDNSELDEQQGQAQSENQHQPYATASMQSGAATPLIGYMMPTGQLEAGQAMSPAAYPYMDPFYGGMFAAYAGQHVIHPQLIGVHHPGVPLPTDAVEEPVYVNAKQYHGILRRRQSRAKAESENKLAKIRKAYLKKLIIRQAITYQSQHTVSSPLDRIKFDSVCGNLFLDLKLCDGKAGKLNIVTLMQEDLELLINARAQKLL